MNELIIVDDEPAIVDALSREIVLELGKQSFEIKGFTNPLTALEYIKDDPSRVFLVISDLRMPEMNGSDFLREVRRLSREVRTILLTAFSDLGTIQRAVSTSLQGLIIKPWVPDIMIAEIKRAEAIWLMEQENRQLKRRLDQLLMEAGDFQTRLFSHDLPVDGPLACTVAYEPLEQYRCGGDFYDIMEPRPGTTLVILGDVTGHGPRSAMIASMVKTVIHGIERSNPKALLSPEECMSQVNATVCDLLAAMPEILIAMTVLVVDKVAKTIKFCIAGLPPLYVGNHEGLEALGVHNPLIGANKDQRFVSQTLRLKGGEKFILITDGLFEGPGGRVILDIVPVLQEVLSTKALSASAVLEAFRTKMPQRRFGDDATVLALELT